MTATARPPIAHMQWLFGYGSLIWRPSFAYSAQAPAMIRGWARRFWQGSTDHRGVPGAPGRVVTLVPEPAAVCPGRAYRIPVQSRAAVFEALDHREKGGYRRQVVDIEFSDGRRAAGLTYIADPDNANFLGPATIEHIAAQVLRSRGPSGHNVDYVLQLADALAAMNAHDPDVFDLAARVRALLGRAE